MTRPIFGKMKTIVLPAPENGIPLTLADYKEKYGIDLTEWLYLEEGYIKFNFPKDTLILIQDDGGNLFSDGGYIGIIPVSAGYLASEWESGVNPAETRIGSHDGTGTNGIDFQIPASEDFELSNVIVQGTTY